MAAREEAGEEECMPPADGLNLQHSHRSPPREANFAMSIDPHADDYNNSANYLTQPEDSLPTGYNLEPMGPIGPWATGKVDWSPLAGLTGTRPVVDRYSITRFSPNEWRTNNSGIVLQTKRVFDRAFKNQYSSKNAYMRLASLTEKTQRENTEHMQRRAQLINKWKTTLETAIKAIQDEITILAVEIQRLKRSLAILESPEMIVKECINKRCGRPETELVRDGPEEELINELALIAEIRKLLTKTLQDLEQQQIENRNARQRLEYDWSDKKEAYEMDADNAGLNNMSATVMFRPGAVRRPAEQSSEQYWEHFTMSTLEDCEKCRQKSVSLRHILDSTLLNAARDLRTQADVVEKAFVSRINCTQENLKRFENDVKDTLQRLANTENLIVRLHRSVRSLDPVMKVAQTRMNNRSLRPNVENCRDLVQQELIEEVATIASGVSIMLQEIDEAENINKSLMQHRSTLEREIRLKRRALWLDRERCMQLRLHFPSANALSGYAAI